MVFKKFIKRNGKTYGPYLYESRRVNGKIITNYVGTSDGVIKEDKLYKKLSIFLSFALVISLIVLIIFYSRPTITGRMSVSVDSTYKIGEPVQGVMHFVLSDGELLPKNTKLVASNANSTREFLISDLISQNSESGSYYIVDRPISGFGEGYGFAGEKKVSSKVNFKLRIIGSQESQTGAGSDSNVADSSENSDGEASSENKPEETQNSGYGSDSDSAITGNAVRGITGRVIDEQIIDASASYNSSYNYVLINGQTAELVSGSVTDENGSSLDDSYVKILKDENILTVTTDYFRTEKGFGAEYVTEHQNTLDVDLSKLGMIAHKGGLSLELIYGENVISSSDIDLKIENVSGVSANFTNQVIPLMTIELIKQIPDMMITNGSGKIVLSKFFSGSIESYGYVGGDGLNFEMFNDSIVVLIPNENFSAVSSVKIIAYGDNQSLESNLFNVVVSSSGFSMRTIQYGAVINKPVKWKKVIEKKSEENISIFLPSEASNIKLIDLENSKEVSITGNIIIKTETKKKGLLSTIFSGKGKTTGYSVLGNSDDNSTFSNKEIEIPEGSENVEIEYETPAPIAIEKNIEGGKTVTISSDVHYDNISAYTILSTETTRDKIKLYAYDEKGEKSSVDFSAYDTNENGDVDYIEWLVPHLSNVTYEVIIEISKAEHLDSERVFISDIYDSVKARDGTWSEVVSDGEYVSVDFNSALNSKRDITVYAKAISGSPSLEVYEKGSDEKIADFGKIEDNKKYKVLLKNLIGNQLSFDLKVVGGSVAFDYIVDPTMRRIFVTSSTYASGGGVSGFDSDCLNDGNNPDGSGNGNWKALVMTADYQSGYGAASTRNLTTEWVLQANTDYVLADQTYIATTDDGTSCGGPMFPYGDNIFASPVQSDPTTTPWTGMYYDGMYSNCWMAYTDGDCDQWNDGTINYMRSGVIGSSSATNFNALYYNTASCDSSETLYCVEQSDYVPDTTPPVISITSPSAGSYYNSGSYPGVSYSYDDAEYCYWSTDNSSWTDVSCGYTGFSPSEGANTLYLKATDSQSNEGFAEVSFTYDTTNPDIGISSPTSGTYSPETWSPDINWDDSTYCEYSYDGYDYYSTTCDNNVPAPSEGTGITLYLRGTDEASNQGNPSSSSFDYLSTPVISITSPTTGTYGPVTWSPDIDWGTSESCEYSYDNYNWYSTTCDNNVPAPSEGTDIVLYVRGSVGYSQGTAQSNSFNYDSTAPSIYISSPTSGTYTPETWSPSIDWGDSTYCEYSYDNSDWYSTTCDNSVPAPSDGTGITLYLRGNDSVSNQGTANSDSFDYTSSIFSCGMTISSPGVYTLDQNLNCDETAITIDSDDVVFDGNKDSYSITYGNSATNGRFGIAVTGTRSNITIKNSNIGEGSSIADSTRSAIYFYSSTNNIIQNNVLSSLSPYTKAIYFEDTSTNSYFSSNDIDYPSDTDSYGINMNYGNNDIFSGNTINYGPMFSVSEFTNLTIIGSIGGYSIWSAISTPLNLMNETYGNVEFSSVGSSISGSNLFGAEGSGADVEIGNNYVYANPAQFNSLTNVTFYNMPGTFTSPAILRDGILCNSGTTPPCENFTSLNDAIVKFSVGGWSNYSIGEVDLTPPTISITSPTTGTYGPNIWSPDISWDDSVEGTCEYSYDNSNWYSMSCDNNVPTPSDGTSIILYLRGNDSVNNQGTQNSNSFDYDSAAPVVTIITPDYEASYGPVTWPGVSYTYDDSISCDWSLNGDNWNPTACGSAEGYSPSEGANNIFIKGTDSLGNYNIIEGPFTYDSSAPSISITSPTTGSYSSSTWSPDISWGGSVAGTCEYSPDNATWYSTACDNSVPTPSDGSDIILFLRGNDSVSNQGTANSDSFDYDSTLPFISLTYPENISYNLNVSELNYTYDDIHPDSCWYSTDSGMTNSTSFVAGINVTDITSIEGSNTWTLFCNDSVDNENSANMIFVKDTLPPYFTNFENQNIYNNQSLVYQITATDMASSVSCFTVNDTINFNINCSGYLKNITALSVATYNLNITVNDSLNNLNSSVISIIVAQSDTTAPFISIVYPENNSNSTNVNLEINYTVFDLNLRSCWWTNNTGVINYSLTCGANITNQNWKQGVTEVVIYANDSSGNMNSSHVKFNIDSVNPLVTIINPENKTYGAVSIPVNITLDEAGYCEYSFDGGKNNYTLSANSSFTGFNATNISIADGSYIVSAYCNDTIGNKNYTTQVSFTKDTTGLRITFLSPVNDSNFNFSSVDFNVSLSKVGSWCGLSLDGEANVTMSLNSSLTGANYTNSTMSEGFHNVTFSCNDTTNNFAYASLSNILVDTIYPLINFTNPTNANGTTSNNVRVNISTTEINNHYVLNNMDNSIVGWWRFEGNAYDNSGNGNNLAVNNAIPVRDGKFGRAYNFPGVSGYTMVNSSLSPQFDFDNRSITLSVWLKPYSFVQADANGIRALQLYDVANSHLAFNIQPTTQSNSTCYLYAVDSVGNFNPFGSYANVINLNVWNNYVFVLDRNNNNSKSYVNGQLIATRTDAGNWSGIFNFSGKALGVGSRSDNAFLYNGSVDDLIIFNRALNANEVASLYDANTNKYDTTINNLTDGTHTIKGYVVDQAGNINSTETRSVILDFNGPTISVVSPLNQTYASTSLNFNVSTNENTSWCGYSLDNAANVTMTAFNTTYFNYSLAGLSRDSHNITFSCNDSSGNIGTTSLTYFAINKVPYNSTAVVLTSLDPSGKNDSLYDLNCSTTLADDDGNAMNVTVEWYRTITLIYSQNYAGYSNGSILSSVLGFGNLTQAQPHSCRIKIYDGLNYSSKYNSNNLVTGVVGSGSAPVVSVVYPETLLTYEDSVTTLNYTVYDVNPSKCWYSTNMGLTNSSSVAAGINFTGLSSAEGTNTWTVYCNDTTGNLGKGASTFGVGTNIIITCPPGQVMCHNVCTIGSCGGCSTTWDCSSWGYCLNSFQNRTCEKVDPECDASEKPATVRACTANCTTANWNCSSLSLCINGKQSQTCNDLVGCNDPKINTFDCEIKALNVSYRPTKAELSVKNATAIFFSAFIKDDSVINGNKLINAGWSVNSESVLNRSSDSDSLESTFVRSFTSDSSVKLSLSTNYLSQNKEINWNIKVVDTDCNPDWVLNWGSCDKNGYKFVLSEFDNNNCSLSYVGGSMQKCFCVPNWQCSDWSECKVNYDVGSFITETVRQGVQTRTCEDINPLGCEKSYVQANNCTVGVVVRTREVEWCNETYVELINNDSGRTISRLKEERTEKSNRLDISFITAHATAYCNYCFDGIKDYDEEGVDCGGPSCSSCSEIMPVRQRNWWMLWIVVGLMGIYGGVKFFLYRRAKNYRYTME